jgi:hypothetical protein
MDLFCPGKPEGLSGSTRLMNDPLRHLAKTLYVATVEAENK